MKTRDVVVKRIKELCKKKKMSINALAVASAVPPSTLKNIVNGTSKNPGIVTLKMLCDGLEITLAEFFNTKTFNELEQEIQ